MSRNWTGEELVAARETLEKKGYPRYEEFGKDLRQVETDRENTEPNTQRKGRTSHEYHGKD